MGFLVGFVVGRGASSFAQMIALVVILFVLLTVLSAILLPSTFLFHAIFAMSKHPEGLVLSRMNFPLLLLGIFFLWPVYVRTLLSEKIRDALPYFLILVVLNVAMYFNHTNKLHYIVNDMMGAQEKGIFILLTVYLIVITLVFRFLVSWSFKSSNTSREELMLHLNRPHRWVNKRAVFPLYRSRVTAICLISISCISFMFFLIPALFMPTDDRWLNWLLVLTSAGFAVLFWKHFTNIRKQP